jgi:drug/metabolite transporter (DMT)-like permease
MINYSGSSIRGVWALVAVGAIYAAAGVIVRWLDVYGLSGLQQLEVRALAGAALGLPYFMHLLFKGKHGRLRSRDWWLIAARLLLGYVIGMGCFIEAVRYTSLANAAFLCALPITSVLGWLFLREAVRLPQVVAVTLGSLGAALISVHASLGWFALGYGELMALLSTSGIALSTILWRFHSANADTFSLAYIPLLVLALATLLLTSALSVELPSRLYSWDGVASTLGSGVALLAGSQLAGYGIKRVSAGTAGIILMLESPFAVLLGLLLYSELPNSSELLGGALITLGACLCIERRKQPDVVPAVPLRRLKHQLSHHIQIQL